MKCIVNILFTVDVLRGRLRNVKERGVFESGESWNVERERLLGYRGEGKECS